MAPSLLPSLAFPFDLSPVNSRTYLSDPTRSLGIVIREHFRHHRAVQWEREKELRAAPEYVERPLCPAPLLPFCSFIAILHAQSADLADYADYGKYTQTQTSTHIHSFSIQTLLDVSMQSLWQLQHISLVILPCHYLQNWISFSLVRYAKKFYAQKFELKIIMNS